MTQAVFVGHKLHHKTKSSEFFKSIIRSVYDVVDELDFDPEEPDEFDYRALLSKRYDAYLIYQTEHVLDVVNLPAKSDVFVIPMYDAAVQRPPNYWRLHSDCTYISFSRRLHAILQEASCNSVLVQYFPEPAERVWSADNKISAFFWERRPGEDYDIRTVLRTCAGLEIDALHVHVAADFGDGNAGRIGEITQMAADMAPRLTLTFSSWFESKDEFISVVRKHPVYFAARKLEGIGMSFLEAMAAGQVVIGWDLPTLNEYITDGYNGVLIGSPDEVPQHVKLDADRLKAMSEASLSSVRKGYEHWTQDKERLVAALQKNGIGCAWDPGTTFSESLRERAGARRLAMRS